MFCERAKPRAGAATETSDGESRVVATRYALVVQWIGFLPPKEEMQVRFLPRAQVSANSSDRDASVVSAFLAR